MQSGFANDTMLRSFLRDFRAPFCSARALVLLAVVTAFLGLIGPFGTFGEFSATLRFVYWTMIVLGTASVSHATSTAVETFFAKQIRPA